jgi:nucleoside-diphosphate-sugar epimerase
MLTLFNKQGTNMKILLTGSSGFIGQHLLPKLSMAGHTVHCLKSDLLDYKDIEAEVLMADPELIIHLAARTEVEHSFYEPMTFGEVNYLGTVNLANSAAKLKNLKNFIFASTMEVYGWQPVSDLIRDGKTPITIPAFDETTIPNPNAPYAVAKYACEKYLEYAHRSMGLKFCALRQTNTYGRTDNDFFVVEQIIHQMLTKQEINLGYKHPYRNFLFIDDLIDLWLHLTEKCDKINNGEIFTVGPNNPISIGDLADKIADMIGWQGKINWNSKPKRAGEIYLLNSSHDLVTERTGWKPTTDLNTGLKKTIEIWQHNLTKT